MLARASSTVWQSIWSALILAMLDRWLCLPDVFTKMLLLLVGVSVGRIKCRYLCYGRGCCYGRSSYRYLCSGRNNNFFGELQRSEYRRSEKSRGAHKTMYEIGRAEVQISLSSRNLFSLIIYTLFKLSCLGFHCQKWRGRFVEMDKMQKFKLEWQLHVAPSDIC